MKITRLTVRNFRNYRDATAVFHPRVNCLVGSNAQGKTNLLEAVYLLSLGRSFRLSDYRQLIHWGEAAGRVLGETEVGEIRHTIEVELGPERKQLFVDGKQRTGREPWRQAVVLFAPEEVLLFKEVPAVRRSFLDRVATMLLPAHAVAVARYERIVTQRNRLLKVMGTKAVSEGLIDPWNRELATWGQALFKARETAVDAINAYLPAAYRRMAERDPPAQLTYRPYCGADVLRGGPAAIAAWFARQQDERALDEVARQHTLMGPHRDNCTAELAGNDLQTFGSQGQHRSLVLAIKVAEGEISRERCGEVPLFLLDDVTSELDPIRTAAFFSYLAAMEGQVIWTTTARHDIPPAVIHRIFAVADGRIEVE
ncbi:MAG: DNA replication/repair protein RecF [Deltaproteobacteria bacterium]|nr:DNA replication/repair protein RecF [Deltaproteobacteria bacterium]